MVTPSWSHAKSRLLFGTGFRKILMVVKHSAYEVRSRDGPVQVQKTLLRDSNQYTHAVQHHREHTHESVPLATFLLLTLFLPVSPAESRLADDSISSSTQHQYWLPGYQVHLPDIE